MWGDWRRHSRSRARKHRWRGRAFPLGGVVLEGQMSQLQVGPLGLELKREGQVCAGRWRRRSFQHRDILGMKSSPLVLPTPSLVPQVKLQPERGAQEDPALPPSSQAPPGLKQGESCLPRVRGAPELEAVAILEKLTPVELVRPFWCLHTQPCLCPDSLAPGSRAVPPQGCLAEVVFSCGLR